MFRISVYYQGAAAFNKLPLELVEELPIVSFENKSKDCYRET